MKEKCFLCGYDADYSKNNNRDIIYFKCPRCGRYGITEEAKSDLDSPKIEDTKYIFSGITRYRTEYGLEPLIIMSHSYESSKEDYYVPRNISQKLDLLLFYLGKKSEYVGSKVQLNVVMDYPIAFSKNYIEFINFLGILVNKNFIEKPFSDYVYILKAEGWDYLENKKIKVIPKDQAFIAMWFKEQLDDAYVNGFSKALNDLGYKPMRIDLKEHNNKIDDEIIAEIKNSAFLIADFTGQRGGVYFEAGFAKGLGIPVIWTCNRNDLKNLHFDTRQFNHIEWTDSSDLYTKLVNRIKATIK